MKAEDLFIVLFVLSFPYGAAAFQGILIVWGMRKNPVGLGYLWLFGGLVVNYLAFLGSLRTAPQHVTHTPANVIWGILGRLALVVGAMVAVSQIGRILPGEEKATPDNDNDRDDFTG